MMFAKTHAEVRRIALEMLDEAQKAENGGHGHKTAHKKMRKLSNELTKLLLLLRKDSVAACGGDADATAEVE
jgi:hypothetical protein